MRTIGIITRLNPIVIKVYDDDTSKVIEITPTHYDNSFPYHIFSPVEYHKDTNSINILQDNNLTKEELAIQMKTLIEVMSTKENAKEFLKIISDAFPPEIKSSHHK